MAKTVPTPEEVVAAIKDVAAALGRSPSRPEFIARSGITEYHILKHFESWNAAVRSAGLDPDETNIRANDEELLADWATLVRKHRRIPPRHQYRREGRFGPGVFDRHFGPWSGFPAVFRRFAEGRPEWADVVALLPVEVPMPDEPAHVRPTRPDVTGRSYMKLDGRPTYGDPIDFRGLRHAPVNEDGVVFLNFREHGHPVDGCDVIVCWRHNWPECPSRLEVVGLESVIRSLGRDSDDGVYLSAGGARR